MNLLLNDVFIEAQCFLKQDGSINYAMFPGHAFHPQIFYLFYLN
jgi:hypothetical protein